MSKHKLLCSSSQFFSHTPSSLFIWLSKLQTPRCSHAGHQKGVSMCACMCISGDGGTRACLCGVGPQLLQLTVYQLEETPNAACAFRSRALVGCEVTCPEGGSYPYDRDSCCFFVQIQNLVWWPLSEFLEFHQSLVSPQFSQTLCFSPSPVSSAAPRPLGRSHPDKPIHQDSLTVPFARPWYYSGS